MAIKIEHHHIEAAAPLLAPSTFPNKAGTLVFSDSLHLNEYCYAVLKPESSIKRIVGTISSLLIVTHCEETKRTAVVSAGAK